MPSLVKVRFRYSTETLPYLIRRVPPRVGELVRAQTIAHRKSNAAVRVPAVTDIGEIIETGLGDVPRHVQLRLDGMLLGCLGQVENREHFVETTRINDDMNECLRDAAEGRWDTSEKFSDFLSGFPEDVRKDVERLGPMTAWVRRNEPESGMQVHFMEFARVYFWCYQNFPYDSPRNAQLRDKFFHPVAKKFHISKDRVMVHGTEAPMMGDILPMGMVLEYDEVVAGVGGKRIENTAGDLRGRPQQQLQQEFQLRGGGGGGGGGGGNGVSPDQVFRAASELSREEKQWLLNELIRREDDVHGGYGGGGVDDDRRRQRGGGGGEDPMVMAPPAIVVAPSPLTIYPPLLVIGGIPRQAQVHPLADLPPFVVALH